MEVGSEIGLLAVTDDVMVLLVPFSDVFFVLLSSGGIPGNVGGGVDSFGLMVDSVRNFPKNSGDISSNFFALDRNSSE